MYVTKSAFIRFLSSSLGCMTSFSVVKSIKVCEAILEFVLATFLESGLRHSCCNNGQILVCTVTTTYSLRQVHL